MTPRPIELSPQFPLPLQQLPVQPRQAPLQLRGIHPGQRQRAQALQRPLRWIGRQRVGGVEARRRAAELYARFAADGNAGTDFSGIIAMLRSGQA